MKTLRILIAGIGNIFLGDDAFGCEVITQLLHHPLPGNITVKDFGIRGMDLTYALLDNIDVAILIDAVPRGDAPGTVYLIEPDPVPADSVRPSPEIPLIDMHAMHPEKVLRLLSAMGGAVGRILLVGCEPTPFDAPDEMTMGLTPAVEAAVPEAVRLVLSLLEEFSPVGGTACATSTDSTATIFTKGDHHHVELSPS